ncbi:proprotein convertase P-domain-containing protein [Photobacterium sp. TY1-4]|uniref:proprotein convertase P-domain-containing protein n=1 Tax=Photobacterium sp. TY1-4 TaxID=2899122 RepID=UPI0021C0CBFD|nr:proprotein convertase P-domain-containing protein [Photobacterium sp. TY1-4]UXI01690.1 proprotein convertase P-domain-containing protein [Photobacterium sp. TY1-4]
MNRLNLAASLVAAVVAAPSVAAPHLDYPQQMPAIGSVAEAKAYVQSRYPHTETLVHRYTRHSLLGTHYNFVQQNTDGQPCEGAVVVTTDQDGVLHRVFHTLVDNPASCSLNQPLPPRAHRLAVPPAGEVVQTQMQVFDPDPRTAVGWSIEGEHSNVAEITIPAEAYQRVSGVDVTRSDGQLYLANSRVVAVDFTEMHALDLGPQQGVVTVQAGDGFDFTRQESAFRDVNAFYHLDHALQYLEQLGFVADKALFTVPLRIDAQGQSTNNSTYLSDVGMLAMGVGGVPDSEDADVVLHEFGHAINDKLVPDWKGGDSEAIGEGFGDYWAGAYSFWVQRDRSTPFELDVFANWDGAAGANKSMRSLNDTEARYYPEMDYRAHVSVYGTLSDQLWSTPLFQTLKQGVAIYGNGAFDEFNRIVLEGMAGMGFGMKMSDLARSTVDAAQRLYPNKDYARLLAARFKQHGILRDVVVLAQHDSAVTLPTVQSEAQAATLTATLVNTTDQPLESYRAELAIPAVGWHRVISQESIAAGAQQSIQAELPQPSTLQCGERFEMTAGVEVRHDASQRAQYSQQQLTFTYGQPVLSLPLQQSARPLADARQIDESRIVLGESLSAFKAGDASGVVDDDFAVHLSLSHPRFAELKVVLRAPSGAGVSLMDYQDHPLSDFSHTLTLANTPKLATLRGEPLAGNWILEITDRVVGSSGQLHRWGIGHVTGYQCGEHQDTPVTPTTSQPDGSAGDSGSSGGAAGWLSLLAGLVIGVFRRKSNHINTIEIA